MAKKHVTLPLTSRQCILLEPLLDSALEHMAQALKVAKEPAEAEFYRTQPDKFRPLKTLLAAAAKKSQKSGKPEKVKLSAEGFGIVMGVVHRYKMEEVRRIAGMDDGEAKTAALTAFDEWEVLDVLLDQHDPRYHDHSQDAEPDEDEEAEHEDDE